MKNLLLLIALLVTSLQLTAQEKLFADFKKVFEISEKIPKFIGGDTKLSEFFSTSFDFSKSIAEEKWTAALLISHKGILLSIEKINGEKENTDQLVGLLTQISKEWEPGVNKGREVTAILYIEIDISKDKIVVHTSQKPSNSDHRKTITGDFEKGGFDKDGYKEGVWEYYDKPGDLMLKIDYSTSQLLFLKPDTNEYTVKVDGQWKNMKLDVQPRYIGSMNDLKKVYAGIEYPMQAKENETAGKFYITFEIDTLGKAGNYEVINDIGDKCSTEVLNALEMLPNYWLVAQKNGKLYTAKYCITVFFDMFIDGRKIPPKASQPKEAPPLAKLLDVISFKAIAVTREVRGGGR